MFRPVKIRHYLAIMKAKGHSAETVLAGSGITESMLATPNFLTDFDQSRTVVANMIALTGDHGIGLEIGGKTELVNLGLVGYAMMSSRSLRQTIQHWISYSNALVGVPLQVRLEERAPDNWSLVFMETSPLGAVRHFCVEEQLVMAFKLGCDLAPTPPNPISLELAYPSPSHSERYSNYFDCPVCFDARDNRISFNAPRLDYQLKGEDAELNQLCSQQCELVLKQMRYQGGVVAGVLDVLSKCGGAIPTIDEMAHELKVSSRTLRRHLQAEGYTYQQVTNEFRAKKAKEFLSSALAAKEVSYRLGFSEPNSFRRAFKLWTGQTVSEYLEAQYGCRRTTA